MTYLIDRLFATVQNSSPLCLGLDTDPSYLPSFLKQQFENPAEAIFQFNRLLMEAALPRVGVVKVQIAYYEALGLAGLKAYAKTLQYAREKQLLTIADIKRADIGATSQRYAVAHYTGDFAADFVTLNPYLGLDSLLPFLAWLKSGEKGAFVLVRTSNPSASEIQDQIIGETPLYLHIGKMVESWAQESIGNCGYSCLGAVFGATYPQQLAEFRRQFPGIFLLVPGYGAQGATASDLQLAFNNGNGAVINVSRSILTNFLDCTNENQFQEKAHTLIGNLAEELKMSASPPNK